MIDWNVYQELYAPKGVDCIVVQMIKSDGSLVGERIRLVRGKEVQQALAIGGRSLAFRVETFRDRIFPLEALEEKNEELKKALRELFDEAVGLSIKRRQRYQSLLEDQN